MFECFPCMSVYHVWTWYPQRARQQQQILKFIFILIYAYINIETGSHCVTLVWDRIFLVAQAGLRLMISCPILPKCWVPAWATMRHPTCSWSFFLLCFVFVVLFCSETGFSLLSTSCPGTHSGPSWLDFCSLEIPLPLPGIKGTLPPGALLSFPLNSRFLERAATYNRFFH